MQIIPTPVQLFPAATYRKILGLAIGCMLGWLPYAATAATEIRLQQIKAAALQSPTDMRPLPARKKQWLVTEQKGLVRRIQLGNASVNHVVLDWRKRTLSRGHEEGLLSLALHPKFTSNGWLFLYGSRANPRRTEVSRIQLHPKTLRPQSAPQIILTINQPYANHNGGQLVFGRDGMLYLGVGDGGAAGDPMNHGQNLASLLGTILRLDVNRGAAGKPYAIPADNPFVANPSARPEIWAFGLRNPWRMSFDRKTNALWVADVGQNRIEEVNLVQRGANYGWARMEGSRCFRPAKNCRRSNLRLPITEYTHGPDASITGGYVYRGKKLPALAGHYLFADYISGRIRAIPSASRKPRPPRLLLASNLRISSFAQDHDGELYLLEHSKGEIWQIVSP